MTQTNMTPSFAAILAKKSPAVQAFFASIMEANFIADLRAAIEEDYYARMEPADGEGDDYNKYGVAVGKTGQVRLASLSRTHNGVMAEWADGGFLGTSFLTGPVAAALWERYGHLPKLAGPEWKEWYGYIPKEHQPIVF